MRVVFAGVRPAAVVVIVAAVAGCGGDSDDLPDADGNGREAAEEGVSTIGMSQCNREDAWRVQMEADVEAAAAKHADLKVIFKDAGGDSAKQQQHVEEFIAQRVDLIVISPNESQSLTEPVAKAYEAGIPVIVLDRPVVGDKYTCFIDADNTKIGEAVTPWLADNLDGQVNVLEFEDPETSTPGPERHDGFHDGLKDPRFRILREIPVSGKKDLSREEMEKALAKFEKIDVVFAHNDAAAHGAYLAAKEAGRENEITLVGIDALPEEGIRYVEAGELSVSFECPTGGSEAVDVALKILAGEDVPKKITLKSRFFTQDNLDQGGQPVK